MIKYGFTHAPRRYTRAFISRMCCYTAVIVKLKLFSQYFIANPAIKRPEGAGAGPSIKNRASQFLTLPGPPHRGPSLLPLANVSRRRSDQAQVETAPLSMGPRARAASRQLLSCF